MKVYNEIAQQTPEWFKLRAGVLTGSTLKDIMTGGYNKDGITLNATAIKAMKGMVYKLIGGEFSFDEEAPNPSNYLMSKGNELEPIARAKYEEITGTKVLEIGFIKKNDFLGLSPDGCVETGKKDFFEKHIEVKCQLGNNSANFYKYMFEGLDALINGKEKYIWQIVHNFIINSDLKELDFVLFNPNIVIKEKQLFIITVKREDIQEYIEKAQNRILEFRKLWEEHITLLIK